MTGYDEGPGINPTSHRSGDVTIQGEFVRYSGVDPVIGDPPCKRCDGTGNELFSMYRRCSDCGGTGAAAVREEQDG